MVTCSVIIINYNTADLTLRSVQSVLDHTTSSNEIIVVDNASELTDFKTLEKGICAISESNIKLIRSRINTGFGGGNMAGVQHAKGDYYIFLNSDAFLQEDSIRVMIDFLENNPSAGITGARSIDENGNVYKSFDHKLNLGKEIFGDKLMSLLFPNKHPSRKKQFKTATKVGGVPGSFFACRARDFDQLGGFDTNLFLYYEEKDLAYRMEKILGQYSYTLPDTTYIHLKGKSTSPSFRMKKELKISQFYCIRKNLGLGSYFLFFTANLLKFTFKAPFSNKNRKYLLFLLGGASLTGSLKHQQKIYPCS